MVAKGTVTACKGCGQFMKNISLRSNWHLYCWIRCVVTSLQSQFLRKTLTSHGLPTSSVAQHLQPTQRDPLLHFYNGWLNAWLECAKSSTSKTATLSLHAQADYFKHDNSKHILDYEKIQLLVRSFKQSLDSGEILFGGVEPPSCEETNMASAAYNPRTECPCNGLFPIPSGTTLANIFEKTQCIAIEQTLRSFHTVVEKQREWNHSSLYSVDSLQRAVSELLLANSDIDEIAGPETCFGLEAMPVVNAPDRRPHLEHDTQPAVQHLIYPKAERVKLCVDAKQYLVVAANTSVSDKGLITAIADAGNDILIGDYYEVADDETLWLLQQNGAAAVAFIKLCQLAGTLSNWHFDNIMSSTLHFRVLGYYRNHADILGGIYGSRMTEILVHRYIDLSLFHAVVTASLATGQELDDYAYFRLNEACTLINDLVDFRSDTARKQRENVVLRGVRGNICRYLDGLLGRCLELVVEAVQHSPVSARVVMSFCNWALLGSHHKVYELVKETTPRCSQPGKCDYRCVTDPSGYGKLLEVLEPYGTLGPRGPAVNKTRAHMDIMYTACSSSEKLHLAWLADVTRSLMEPPTLRKIVDVVHFEWRGNVGDVNYCP